MQNYPVQYKNLLIKAKLLGEGLVRIEGLVHSKKLFDFDEVSSTFSESSRPEVDNRRTQELFTPIDSGNGRVEGDWRTGLTAEEVRIINEECGVPIYTPDSMIHIMHGKEYDMTRPAHAAEYRILITSGLIAKSRKNVATGQRFFFVDETDNRKEKETERNLRRTAIKISGEKSIHEKRKLIELMNHKWRIGVPANMTDEMVSDTFEDLAYNRYKIVCEADAQPDVDLHLLVYGLVSANELYRDGDGSIHRANGQVIAESQDDVVAMLKKDKVLKLELETRLGTVTGIKGRVFKSAVEELAADARFENRYDTNIHEESAVKFWNAEACKQYIAENKFETTLTGADGAEKWRAAVVSIYRGQPNGDVFPKGHQKEDLPYPPVSEDDNEFEKENNWPPDKREVARKESIEFAEGFVEGWTRDEFLVFQQANSELMSITGLNVQPQNTGEVKLRSHTIDFLRKLSPSRREELALPDPVA